MNGLNHKFLIINVEILSKSN